jgi:hypothetical protein
MNDTHGRRPRPRLGRVGWALALAVGAASEASAGAWSVAVEPVHVEVTGHDQHVLTDRQGSRTDVRELATDSALGYRAALLYDRGGAWAYGLDFFIHRTDQGLGPLRVSAASSAAGDRRVFAVPTRSFTSTGPGELLFFQTLEDTTVELWVLDLYARRAMGGGDGPLALLVGLRNADFDNDLRAIAGREGVGGTRIDASSNYSRMMGPMVGLAATLARGGHTFGVELRQSVVFGDIELTRTRRDFVGPPGPFAGPPEEVPPGLDPQRLAFSDDIAVPMSDLRLAWDVRLGEHWFLGASVGGTAWWELAVPPGVDPDRPNEREETTLLTYGAGLHVGFGF